jgi:hypothetical protein
MVNHTFPKLRNDVYIHFPEQKMIAFTERGVPTLGDYDSGAGNTNEEVHEKIKNNLTGKGVKLFKALVDGKT